MDDKLKRQMEYLRKIDTGVVTDALNLLGIGEWTTSIFPTDKDFKCVGPAFTGQYTSPSGDAPPHNAYDVIEKVEPGDVLVLAGAPDGRIFGGNLGLHAKNKGVEAVILDGKTRDITEIEEVPMKLFCRGPLIHAKNDGRYKFSAIQVKVDCDGAIVNPGDIVIGDRDGIVVIPRDKVDDVIYQCEHVAQVEEKMHAALLKNCTAAEAKNTIKDKKIPRP